MKSLEKRNWFVINALITGVIGLANYRWYDEPEERDINNQIQGFMPYLDLKTEGIAFGVRKAF